MTAIFFFFSFNLISVLYQNGISQNVVLGQWQPFHLGTCQKPTLACPADIHCITNWLRDPTVQAVPSPPCDAEILSSEPFVQHASLFVLILNYWLCMTHSTQQSNNLFFFFLTQFLEMRGQSLKLLVIHSKEDRCHPLSYLLL